MISRHALAVMICFVVAFGSTAIGETTLKSTGSYAIVVSEKTYADKDWKPVVDALREKHDAHVISYTSDVRETGMELSALMPNYVCFVNRPGKSDRKFVVTVNRMLRQLDEDPYTDAIWGILTGYEAADALRIARHSEPLTIRSGLSGTNSMNMRVFDTAVKFNECKKNDMSIKRIGGAVERIKCPQDTTKAIVDVLNRKEADCFVTSGHATTKDWQLGYNFRNGQFRCKKGQLFGLDTKGRRFNINSTNPKVYLASGNCLIGNIPRRDCMAIAWMHSGGAYQMSAYTAVSLYGSYGGWGVQDYFVNQPGRFSLAEAFYINNQALVQRLRTEYPKHVGVNFQSYAVRKHRGLVNSLIRLHRIIKKKKGGKGYEVDSQLLLLLWDRDVMAFYGDPAWEARLAEQKLPWTQKLTVKDNVYTFEIRTNKNGRWPRRALGMLLPHRVSNVEFIKANETLSPVISDNFILLPMKGKFRAGQSIKVVFRATPAKFNQSALDEVQLAKKTISQYPAKYRSALMVALSRAGQNMPQIVSVLRDVKKPFRKAALFLVLNMPQVDLKSLTRDFLIKNIELAYSTRKETPWKAIPDDLFMNYVLPYANLNERRDNWRKDFYNRFKEVAWKHKTPGKAATALNRHIYKTLNVSYHATKRPKPHQSPYESTKATYASCTGLSILLVDACRAVGIPARVAGIARWSDRKGNKKGQHAGNHNWVEVWDGRWYHIGAWDGKGLDKAWFTKKTKITSGSKRWHRIHAASFRKTGVSYPLVWNLAINWVPARDVTKRYTSLQKVLIALPDNGSNVVTVKFEGETVAVARGTGTVEVEVAGGLNYIIEMKSKSGKVYRIPLLIPKFPEEEK